MFINRSENRIIFEEKDKFKERELATFFFYAVAYNAGFIKRDLNISPIFRDGMNAVEYILPEMYKIPIFQDLISFEDDVLIYLANEIESFEFEDGVLEFSTLIINLKNNQTKEQKKWLKKENRQENGFSIEKFLEEAKRHGFTNDEISTFMNILVPFPIPRIKDKFSIVSKDRIKSIEEIYCNMRFTELLN